VQNRIDTFGISIPLEGFSELLLDFPMYPTINTSIEPGFLIAIIAGGSFVLFALLNSVISHKTAFNSSDIN
jgi:hypothetical protein